MVTEYYKIYKYCENVMLQDKVFNFIKENNLVPENTTVIAAVSGGADSVCLLDILIKLKDKLCINVEAAHLNHNLRGEESDGDEQYVRWLCEKKNIKLHTKSVDIKAMADGAGIEDTARRARYIFFEEITSGRDAYIATAHTINDNTETFFINLLRGSGGRGLCGIPKQRGNIIRPLLCTDRDSIIAHLEKEGLAYRTDSTNADTVYLRNFIRHVIIPAFKERQGIDINSSISRATTNLTRDNEALDNIAKSIVTDDTNALSKLDDAVLYRVFTSRLEKEYGIILDSTHFHALKSLLSRQNSKELMRDEVYAVNSYGKLKFLKIHDTKKMAVPLKIGENEFYGRRILIKNAEEVYKGLTNNVVDYDKIRNVLQADIRRDGDIFFCQKRNSTSKLKKLLINDKVPIDKKENLVVIRDGDGNIVFVEGYGADKRFAADKNNKNIISIEII